MERFKNRVAVITGGAQGIGEAIAKKLSSEGGTIAILDIQHEKAQLVANNLNSEGANAIALRMDITDSMNVRHAVQDVEGRLGKVDILINNAGWDKAAPFIELTEELWDKVIAINLRGPITITRAVLDGMISRNYGKIVNIASDAGRVGSSGESVYSACKGGMIAFTKTLARELVRYNILVNCICPGPSNTPMIEGMREENPKLVEALQRAIPMRRLGNPDEIAAAVAFLASDEASYITGQTLSVSGGLTMA